ncbi:MAG: extracellular solute-binding protein [Acetivibrio sp.]
MKKNAFKQFFAVLLVLCMMTTVLGGCGKKEASKGETPDSEKESTEATTDEETAQKQPEPVELTIWITSRLANDYTDKAEKQFLEEHPWITLNKVVKDGDPGNEFYQAVAAGNAPDYISASFSMMDRFISAGIVEPLNAYTDKWDEFDSFTKEYVDLFTKDSNVYGIPYQVAPMLFAYNKALFKKAGIAEPPKTWDEAIAAAKLINDPANQVTGYATLAAEWTEWFFQYYVWQAGGDLSTKNDDGTINLTFTDQAVIKAAKFYQQLRSDKVLQSDLTMKFGDLTTNFGLGKIGMMPFAGDWVSEAINNGIQPEDIGLCLPPAGPSGKQSTAIGGSCYVINAKSSQEKKDAAWEYVKFLSSKEYISGYYENIASMGAANPIIIPRDDMSVADFFEFPEEYRQVLEDAKEVGRLEFYGKATFGSYVDRAVQKILIDPNADPEVEFANAQKLAEDEALATFNAENKK